MLSKERHQTATGPSPAQFREACGFHTTAQVTKDGIRYAGGIYSNQFVRNERKARLADRIAPPGTKLEIMVDPFDLGGISVLAHGELITVRCLDSQMAGKSLREWKAERQLERMKADVHGFNSQIDSFLILQKQRLDGRIIDKKHYDQILTDCGETFSELFRQEYYKANIRSSSSIELYEALSSIENVISAKEWERLVFNIEN